MNKEEILDEGFEKLAEEVHHVYCEQYEKDNGKPYWTNGDYSKLSEETKEYDRNIVRWHQEKLKQALTQYSNTLREKIAKEEKEKWIKVFDYHNDMSNERHSSMRNVARVEIDYWTNFLLSPESDKK